MVGTFLPWLRSGRATRNSYETTGTVRRLIAPEGWQGEAFRLWPLLGVLCALAIAAHLVGLRRCAAIVALVVAIAAGAAAFAALLSPGGTYASVIVSGPVTTLVGGAVVLIMATTQLVAGLRSTRSRRIPQGGTPE